MDTWYNYVDLVAGIYCCFSSLTFLLNVRYTAHWMLPKSELLRFQRQDNRLFSAVQLGGAIIFVIGVGITWQKAVEI